MRSGIIRVLSLLLMISLVFPTTIAFSEANDGTEAQMPYDQFTLIEATLPDTPIYPFSYEMYMAEGVDHAALSDAWYRASDEHSRLTVPNADKVRAFVENSARLLLSPDENQVYSPINIWFFLELLSELTEGSSRAQILSALGEEGGADDAVFRALYWDDGDTVVRPAASVWIDPAVRLSDALAARLAQARHASVFQGPMRDDAFNDAFRAWLNAQTNDLLKEIVGGLGLDAASGLSLCTTMYLRCAWSDPFVDFNTHKDTFYAPDGERETDFMTKQANYSAVYTGDGFTSVLLELKGGGRVALVLPEADGGMEALLRSDDLFDFLSAGEEWPEAKRGSVKITVPKVDMLSGIPMEGVLKRMGVTDVFDPEKAAFSKEITADTPIRMASIDQFSRLIMNEEGVEAGSIMMMDGALAGSDEEEPMEFTANRPFLFAVLSEHNIPMFLGVYHTP